jgi:diguanylate cyclase (GGDEF)-like protein
MPEDALVGLSDVAARVMTLAQGEDVEQALALAREAGEDHPGSPARDRAALAYAVAVAHHVRGDHVGQLAASDRCLEHAVAADDPGWISNALSMRAMAHFRQDSVEAAMLDLAQAEVALSGCEDEALRNWAHTGLGYCYLEMRLYELCEPHLLAAVELFGCPIPLLDARTIDLMNLAELYLRWGNELERAVPYAEAEDEAERLRDRGHHYARLAVEEAERRGPVGLLATCRATELCSRPRAEAESSLEELRTAYASPDHLDHHGGRATIGAALARTLWRVGQREEALRHAREAAELSATATDWHVGAAVQWLLVEMQAEAGLPGAAAGRDYAQLLSRVLWQQRLRTLQGARTALDVERLQHDNRAARRAAREDPLTGVGNRRALDDALANARRQLDGEELPTSLLVVDLDDFKIVNDRHGHVVGDQVLRAVAGAVRSVARAEDVVARLGGDEFVVLARGTDEATGRRLARRVAAAIEELEVAGPGGVVRLGASVGVRTTGDGVEVADLLQAADAAMYDAKRGPRRVVGSSSA